MSSFHYASLSMHLELNQQRTNRAYNWIFSERKCLNKGERDSLFSYSRQVGIHEHEMFHCRSTLSTTFGRALFYISQLIKTYKLEIIEATRNRPMLGIVDIERLDSIGQLSYIKLAYTEALWRLLDNPSSYRLKFFEIAHRGMTADFFIPKEFSSDLIYFAGLKKPIPEDVEFSTRCPSLTSVLEAIASWKEYAYVSKILAFNLGISKEWFFSYTKKFTRERLSSMCYRALPDLIYQKTGRSLAYAITGYIIDISLCPPVTKPVSWKEFHPAVRLMQILDIWPTLKFLPWIDYPNYIPLPDHAYELVDNVIAKALNWSTAQDNIRCLAGDIASQMKADSEHKSPPLEVVTRSFLDSRFLLCLTSRFGRGGMFIDPQGNKKSVADLGYLSQPLITSWLDKMSVASHVLPDNSLISFLLFDTLLHLFLDDYVNSSARPPNGFKIAKHFHKQALGWMEINHLPTSHIEGVFDDFASSVLGYKWKHKG